MKILHIVSHLGGGVGSVIMDWLRLDKENEHSIVLLDTANPKAKLWADFNEIDMLDNMGVYPSLWFYKFDDADIVVCHFWDHPMLDELFCDPIPECRLIFWCHKYYPVPPDYLFYPDLFVLTANYEVFDRVPNIKRARAEDRTRFKVIRPTGDISRFLEIEPKPHKGFNIGYVGTVDYKKMYPRIMEMCLQIAQVIPEARFTFIGEQKIVGEFKSDNRFFGTVGKVSDVVPYLAEMDVFGYPLRPDHYGTAEQALGEAMAAGVVPVVMDNPAERKIIQSVMLNGFRAKSEKDYVRCIELLYHDPDLRRIMSHNARSSAKALYDIQTMIGYWNETFDEVMRKYPKRGRKPIP